MTPYLLMHAKDLITELKPQIGKEIHVGPWVTLTQEMVNQFADVTKDHQWIHVDVERAKKESPYKTTIAHGYLTLSLLPYLTESVNPDKPLYPGIRRAINYGLNKVRFPSPVKVGSRIRTRTELAGLEEVKGGGVQVVRKVTLEIEGEEKPGCVAETITMFYF